MSTLVTARPAPAPITERVNGRLRLTYPTRGYAVTRNPFAIWSVLPSIVLSFAALAAAVTVLNDQLQLMTAVAAFMVVSTGLLAISAVTLKGSIALTHDGITFERGKNHLTASWDEVTGLVYKRDAGLCLTLAGQQQTKDTWRMPGGFRASGGTAQIPLRFFGDRQFSILYDIRERVHESEWRPALEAAEKATRSTVRCEIVYAGCMVVGALAVYATYLIHS
jgi:hypothetical protein